MRPGAAPPARATPRDPGPTPHYGQTPRWGLTQDFAPEMTASEPDRTGPSPAMVHTTMAVAMGALAAAALLHLVRYVLLLINRTVLLNRWVAAAGTWLGVAASVIALFAVVAAAVVLVNWLIARRTIAYERVGGSEHRPASLLRLGCLLPVLNLFWAPVFVMELATVEGRLSVLRRRIITWWAVWAVATLLSIWSIATSFTGDPQGIADNTVTTTIAYLCCLATLVYVSRVYLGFEGSSEARPSRRWVMSEMSGAPGESDVPVEESTKEPAA